MSANRSTFWSGNSELQEVYTALNNLVPTSGQVNDPKNNRALEKMRKAANIYYDLYNNGLWNRSKQFAGTFGFAAGDYRLPGRGAGFHASFYERVEVEMRRIVLAAAEEQIKKLNH